MSVTSVMSVKASFELGEKSSRIYIIKINYFYYIYTWVQKKANWKSSLTLMTLVTLMTLFEYSPRKSWLFFLYFSFVTWSVKSTWGSWIYLLIWHLKMLDFGGLRSGPSFKNQVFWHKNGHLLATENGMSYLCTVIRKGHETDKKNFFGGRNFVRPPTNRILPWSASGSTWKTTSCSNVGEQETGSRRER